jgi:hypothetical protein
MVINVSEEYTASVFRIEVSQAWKMVGYESGSKWVTKDSGDCNTGKLV